MSRSPFAPFFEAQGVVVLDGGLATALEDAGHTLDTALWSARLLVDAPDAIRSVHRAYLDAGADCITTVSYQATFGGLGAAGFDEDEAERLLRTSTRLALETRDAFWSEHGGRDGRLRPIVAASVGPYGAYLADGSEYDGRYGVSVDRLRDFHLRRFEVLADSGADVLACETIPSALEAEVLLRILDDVPGVWAWLSFSCRDGARLNDGSSLAEAARSCTRHARVAAVGVNCTPPRFVRGLLESAGRACPLPLIAYPNSGEVYDARTKRWSGDGVGGSWVSSVDDWVDAGARVVGGCCRTGPDVIRQLRRRLTLRPPAPPSPRDAARAAEPG